MKHGVALVLCLSLSSVAHAQGQGGGYIGALLGGFDYQEGVEEAGFRLADTAYAYRLFGGYQISDHFAIEGGIGRTGEISDSFTAMFQGVGEVTLDVDGTYDIYSLRALGIVPLRNVSLLGGIGYYSASVSGPVTARGFGQIGELEGHERGATVIAGIQHDLKLDLKTLSIRGEYEWFDFSGDIKASAVSVGVIMRF
jgi:hypothetical protein